MTAAYEPCVFCDSADVSLDCRISIRRTLEADVTACRRCGLRFVNPPPSPEQIASLYAAYWEPTRPGAPRITRPHYRTYRWGTVYGRALSRRAQTGRMLEIGCGLGFFLKGVADGSGWEVEGVDAAGSSEAFARDVLGIRVTQGRFEDLQFADSRFDLVRAKDVLEHIPYPMPFLEAVYRLVRPGGRVELWLPNGPLDLAPARRAYRKGRLLDMEAGHVLFISPDLLRRMIGATGFEVTHASVVSFRGALRSFGLWPQQPGRRPFRPLTERAPLPTGESSGLWQPPRDRGLKGSPLYARLRAWRACHPSLPAWLPIGFRERFVVRKPER